VADRSYSNRYVRHDLRRRGIGSVIPQPNGQHPCALIDWQAYAQRNQVERLVGRLKQCRRIATRYEKRAANHLAMLQIDAIMRWLQV
jgi:transposase